MSRREGGEGRSVEVGFDNAEYSVTEGTDSSVEVCFSTQQGMFGSSSTSLLANIIQNTQNSGKPECS